MSIINQVVTVSSAIIYSAMTYLTLRFLALSIRQANYNTNVK